jgi:hypothetical protein
MDSEGEVMVCGDTKGVGVVVEVVVEVVEVGVERGPGCREWIR